MSLPADHVRAILVAYHQLVQGSWPDLHPTMAERSRRWATADPVVLEAELEGYLRETMGPSHAVRVFWKLMPRFVFGGCNERFAQDAGLSRAELLGRDDFDPRLPWVLQGAKYRADDQAVVNAGGPKLDIIERQRSTTGAITWVHAAKAPIRGADGTAIGVFGMYELLDDETGRRRFAEYSRRTH